MGLSEAAIDTTDICVFLFCAASTRAERKATLRGALETILCWAIKQLVFVSSHFSFPLKLAEDLWRYFIE